MALTKPQGNMVMKLGTEQASTSGTVIDFTGIPAGTTMVVVMLEGVSVNGVGQLGLRLGDSGGIESDGSYASFSCSITGTTVNGVGTSTTDTLFALAGGTTAAADIHYTIIYLVLKDSAANTWQTSWTDIRSSSNAVTWGTGAKSLSATLDRVQILNSAGDTFDAGSINIAFL